MGRDSPQAPEFQRPARLLDLGDRLSDLHSDIRLVDNTNDAIRYATLSHCWLQNPSETPIKTLRSNIEEHRRGIGFGNLSQVFQQAVIACRRLKIRHLWIDSLCIIQDDVDSADWEREGANMDNIYAGSSATIAMHTATEIPPAIPYRSLIYRQKSETATVHVRQLPYHQDLSANIAAAPQSTAKNEIAPNASWNRVSLRGWCYQERALSRRVFHITPAELLVEERGRIIYCQCTHHCSSETAGFAGWLQSRSASPQTGEILLRSDMAKYTWANAVAQYTQRMFTYESDLLPGLAGLARRLNRPEHNMEIYIAGLWGDSSPENSTLLRWLCWQSLPWESANLADRFCCGCRPRPRRRLPGPVGPACDRDPRFWAPSFSWASRFGPCEFIHDPWKTYEWIATAEVLHFACDTKAEVKYGHVNGGLIDLVGTLYPVLHWSTKHWTFKNLVDKGLCQTQYAYVLDLGFAERWDLGQPQGEVYEDVSSCGMRYVIDAVDDLPENQEVVYLFELFKNTIEDTKIVLVLVPDDGRDKGIKSLCLGKDCPGQKFQSYRRIGIGNFSLDGFLELDSLPNSRIRLI